MAARHAGGGRTYPAKYRALAGFIVASAAFVAIFVAVTLSAFHKPTPHGVPVGIVGSAAVTARWSTAWTALPRAGSASATTRARPARRPGSRSVRSMARWSLPARSCGCLSPRPGAPALSRRSTGPSPPWRHTLDVSSP